MRVGSLGSGAGATGLMSSSAPLADGITAFCALGESALAIFARLWNRWSDCGVDGVLWSEVVVVEFAEVLFSATEERVPGADHSGRVSYNATQQLFFANTYLF